MFTSGSSFLTVARNCALLGLLLAGLLLGGCSTCKEYKEQILQLDSQIADLQRQVGDKEANIAECNAVADQLRADLAEVNAEKDVLVEELEEARTVTVTIPERLLFASGTDMVLDTMIPTLEAIASTCRQYPDWDVFVAGYTDSKKLYEDYHYKWPTNWELGAYRACAVVRYMTNYLDLSAARFAAVSYGPFRPFADNETPEGRKQNRVVQVVLHKPAQALQ